MITGTTSEWLVNDTADIFTVAVDAAGVQLWTKTFDGAAHHTERFRDMAMDSSGGVALAVFSPGADLHPYAVVLRYGSSGVTLMKKQWRAGNDTEVSAIACAADGSVFVSGQYYGETLSHAFVLKYTNSYQFAWAYKHPGGGKDSAFFGVLTDADSNAIAGGWAKASASLNKTLLMRLH